MLQDLARIVNLILSFVLFPDIGYKRGWGGGVLADNVYVAEMIPEASH